MDKDILKFYSSIANEYDDFTSFSERLSSQSIIIEKIIEKYNIKEALDAGCGTGLYSILLAKAGVKVTAVDISREMIRKLNMNAQKSNLKIETLVCDLSNINKYLEQKFDAIFCLGNTIPHILKLTQLHKVYKSFFRVLKPEGVLIVQQLNYDKLLKYKEQIQNIKLVNDKIYVRFYDYGQSMINFFILMIDLRNSSKSSLEKILLKPYLLPEHKEYLEKVGYKKISLYEDLSMNQKYRRYKSKDLVIVAVR